MNGSTLFAFALLLIVAVGHVIRFLLGLDLSIAGEAIPTLWSIPAAMLFGLAAFLLWRESRRGAEESA